jgi:hypothetical protein
VELAVQLFSAVGPYALDAGIENLEGLTELSRIEYRALPKTFTGEKIYTAPELDFLDFQWNVCIGVLRGRIYKISPQLITEDPGKAQPAFAATFAHFFSVMGEPAERMGSGVIWRSPEGNVILEQDRHGDIHRVQFFLTSGLPAREQSIISNLLMSLRLQLSGVFERTGLFWSSLEHSDDENYSWCLARAVEWDDWPMWISLLIAPILLTFLSWLPVITAVLFCNIIWWPIKNRWINVKLAGLVGLLCRLFKWPISIACAAYLLFRSEKGQAIVALLWPILIVLARTPVEVVMSLFGWPPQVGKLQKLFLHRLGYEDTTEV